MTRILVVGDVVDDIGVRPLEPVTTGSDTRAEIRMTPGGSAANVAAWLGHLGTEVTFVGRAGADGVRRHTDALAAHGVDVRVVADPALPTATLVLTLDDAGERTMYVDRAANRALVPADVPADAWDGTSWLHLTAYTLFDPATREVGLGLIADARRRGVGVSLDPSTASFLVEVGAPTFLGWAEGADLLFPNAEAAAILGLTSRAGVVVTDGGRGAWVEGVLHPAHPPGSGGVVDTTGAGDAFCAGYLHGLAAGARQPVAGALAAAARCVRIRGGRPA